MMSCCFHSASTPDLRNTDYSYGIIWELSYYLQSTVGYRHFSSILKPLSTSQSLYMQRSSTKLLRLQSAGECSAAAAAGYVSQSVAVVGRAVKC